MSNETFRFSFEADLSDMNNALSQGSSEVEILEKKVEQLKNSLAKLDRESAKTEQEIEELNAELKRGRISAQEFDQRLEQLTNTQKRLGRETATAQGQIRRYENSIRRLSPAYQAQTVNAGKALPVIQEFSRIIQDAPFGIIGVGNNITQLGDQFGILSRRVGGAGAAFRIVLGALGGPAGLLVLLSAAITTITLFSSRFRKAGNDGENAIQKIRKEVDKLLGPLDKLARISRLNEEIAELRGDSSLSAIRSTLGILEAQNAILKNLIEQEQVKKRLLEIDRDNVSTLEAISRFGRDILKTSIGLALLTGEKVFTLGFEQFLRDYKLFTDFLGKGITVDTSGFGPTKDEIDAAADSQKVLIELLLKQKELQRDINEELNKANQIVGAGLLEIGAGLIAPFIQGGGITEQLQQLAANFATISNALTADAADLAFSAKDSFMGFGKEVAEGLQGSLLNLVSFIAEVTKDARELQKLFDETAENIQNVLKEGFAPALSEFADVLGRELSRGASFIDAFGAGFVTAIAGIVSAIADELIKLGTAAIAIGTVQQALESFTPGAGKIVAGLAAIAVGTALKGIASAAQGSVGTRGRGAVPGGGFSGGGSFSGSVSSTGGSIGTGGTVVFEIAGTKLVGVLNRTLKGKGKRVSDVL